MIIIIFLIIVLFIQQASLGNKISDLWVEIITLQTEVKILKNTVNLNEFLNDDSIYIDPYSNIFQPINETLSIQITDFEEYGSGVKIKFKILNSTYIGISNQEFTFILLDSRFSSTELARKEYTFVDKIPPGSSKKGEITIPDVDYKEIKYIKILVGASTLHYYDR